MYIVAIDVIALGKLIWGTRLEVVVLGKVADAKVARIYVGRHRDVVR